MDKLIFAALAIVLPLSAFASKDEALLSNLKKKINSPKIALEYVYGDSRRWDEYLDHVKKADTEWVRLWPSLRKVSDAGATEQLDISFGYALENNPNLALNEIRHSWINDSEAKGIVEKVCTSVSETYSNQTAFKSNEKEEVLKLIERRVKKMSQIEDRNISSLKNICVEKLKNEETFWRNK